MQRNRKFPLFRAKNRTRDSPLSCSPLSHTCLPPQHRSAAKLYRSNQNSCPSSFSFSFLGMRLQIFKSFRVLLTAKTPTPAARPFHQNPPAYEKSPPYISMVRPPDNHDEAAQVLDRGIVPASAFCENWQRMFLSSNAQTAPCCNHESVQSGSADRSVMGSGTNVQLLGIQKRILVIDSSGLPDLACLCFFRQPHSRQPDSLIIVTRNLSL